MNACYKSLIFLGCLFAACAKPQSPDQRAQDPNLLSLEERLSPKGLPLIKSPPDNPLSHAGIALGRKLFYDTQLSKDLSLSCASCHKALQAFSDPETTSAGIGQQRGQRQAMAIFNLAWSESLFWDGRSASLEAQALEPVINPIEMGESWPQVVNKIKADTSYTGLFAAAFAEADITSSAITKAIAQFERTMISVNSRYDRSLRAELSLTDAEQRGLKLFNSERGECFHCHSGPLFTDHRFHNNGLDAEPFLDQGRQLVSGAKEDLGLFRTPSLRNIALTAPYMHDGRFKTLEEVIDHYEHGIKASTTLDLLLEHRDERDFSTEEKADLIAFLRSLSDETFMHDEQFQRPRP